MKNTEVKETIELKPLDPILEKYIIRKVFINDLCVFHGEIKLLIELWSNDKLVDKFHVFKKGPISELQKKFGFKTLDGRHNKRNLIGKKCILEYDDYFQITSFNLFNKHVVGALESYDEVKKLVTFLRMKRMCNPNSMLCFRGQGKEEHQLIPQIGRNASKNIKEEEKTLLAKLKIEKENLFFHTEPLFSEQQNDWNLLFQAQHLGEDKTRLLDWSMKWEIALWFAVENEKHFNTDAKFYVFNPPNNIVLNDTEARWNFFKKDLDNLEKTYLINSPSYSSLNLHLQIAMIRKMRQLGVFTISPFDMLSQPLNEQEGLKGYFSEYIIPAKCKQKIKDELKANGYDKNFIYSLESYEELM